ncbi:circadian clock KaiB family protein [Pleurocapsales cyanobacterium LEGE 10410]|nr:circadian clock KaiB family protein [Pleurocapsales cyanobacterium LEGE 10410]
MTGYDLAISVFYQLSKLTDRSSAVPHVFKGIALFTPGGDLIYGIDPSKQTQWHTHLCRGLQKIWTLADSPHFLVPGYTATVERWLDPQTHQLKTIAEVYPAVQRYIPLLQSLFKLETTTNWQIAPWQEEYCNRAVIETYRSHFPQLWSHQNLTIRLDPQPSAKSSDHNFPLDDAANTTLEATEGYILRLFISSNNISSEHTLSKIHQLLEQGLTSPYTLKVIDIAKHPEQAAIHQVIVTPTLIRISPQPIRRIVGQLNDIQRVLKIISGY